MHVYTGERKKGRVREADLRDYHGFPAMKKLGKALRRADRRDAQKRIKRYQEEN